MLLPAEAFIPPYPYSSVYLEGIKIKIGDQTYDIDLNDSPSAIFKPVPEGPATAFALQLVEPEFPLTYIYSDEEGTVTLTLAISIGATSQLDTETHDVTDPEFTLGYYVLQFMPDWTGSAERTEQIHDAVVAAVDALEIVSNTISVKPTPITVKI